MDQSAAERITSQRTMSGKELKGDDSETIVSFRIWPIADILRRDANSVASGAKRTSAGTQDRLTRSKLPRCGSPGCGATKSLIELNATVSRGGEAEQ